jgi:hypothetical protein
MILSAAAKLGRVARKKTQFARASPRLASTANVARRHCQRGSSAEGTKTLEYMANARHLEPVFGRITHVQTVLQMGRLVRPANARQDYAAPPPGNAIRCAPGFIYCSWRLAKLRVLTHPTPVSCI